jgi:hypothetical protein
MLRNGTSLAEIEAFIECQPMPEERPGTLWMRAWSERPDESVGSERRTGRPMSSRTQPLTREFWRADEPKVWVRKQPRWGRGWTINWAELWRRLRGRRAR